MKTDTKPPPRILNILLLFLLSQNITASPATQAEVLIKWKNSLPVPPPFTSWSLTNLNNLCNWTSIVCDSSETVSEINLSSTNLNGTLLQFNFTPFINLTRFDLSNNNLSGSIPPAIGNLSKLTYLDLGLNYFDNKIPPEIGRLTELRYLSFFSNYLNGTVPYVGEHVKMSSRWMILFNSLVFLLPPNVIVVCQKVESLDHVLYNGEGPRKVWDFFAAIFGVHLNVLNTVPVVVPVKVLE